MRVADRVDMLTGNGLEYLVSSDGLEVRAIFMDGYLICSLPTVDDPPSVMEDTITLHCLRSDAMPADLCLYS